MIGTLLALLPFALLLAYRCWLVAGYFREVRRGARLAAAHQGWIRGRYRVEKDGRRQEYYQPGRYDTDTPPARPRQEAA